MIESGKHGVIVGKTGSGKSQQLLHLALSNEQPVIIFDTKLDDDFLFLARKNEISRVCHSYKELADELKRNDAEYLIVRPQEFELSNPQALDNYLHLIYTKANNKTVFLDEAYQFHTNGGRAGTGLTAIMTRGRSIGLSLIACTQRPVWVSKFLLTEASYFYIYELNNKADRKIVSESVEYDQEKPPRYHYYYHDFSMHNSELREPVPIFKRKHPPKQPNRFFNFFK
jgi:energy-coupling factor transporter ATP-binding protein EcfA2